ncbi:MAG: trypsin-like peptidase domain-containing protein [Phycisphaerae bacterium]|nr:trypsin-like peptidase domain-containing protein [Phycisphaerae bacterium]MDW8261205.1 trypsin-like peptidase domain-containing protein [Phycisphaerales bacterium]
MTRWKQFLTVLTLGAVGAAGWHLGSGLVENVRYARALEQVQLSREQLSRAEDLAGIYKGVSKAIEPSVVLIEVKKTAPRTASSGDLRRMFPLDDETLRRFFPDRDGDGEPDIPGFDGGGFDQTGQGSGVIMETDGSSGFIITNNHVAGGADQITVTLHDGREIKRAKLVGADPKTDLAVIRIEADNLIAAPWGDSDKLEKGDIVMAFGAPFGYVGSMTHGIVSALNRNNVGILNRADLQGYENFIQVDCPINPGNSGGPLVNVRGEVVGINTAILSRTGGFQGVGFSIPSNQARFVYDQLRKSGRVIRGWLGVGIQNISAMPGIEATYGFKGNKGVLISEVRQGPAEGKLRDGDIVIAIDGKPTDDMSTLRNIIATTPPGTKVKLRIFRDGKEQDVEITVGEQPDNLAAVPGAGSRQDGSGDQRVTAEKLGLRLVDPTPRQLEQYGLSDGEGALVVDVNRNSAAFRDGVRPGDLITRIGDIRVTNVDSALEALAQQDLSKGVRMHVTSRVGKRFVFIRPEEK